MHPSSSICLDNPSKPYYKGHDNKLNRMHKKNKVRKNRVPLQRSERDLDLLSNPTKNP